MTEYYDGGIVEEKFRARKITKQYSYHYVGPSPTFLFDDLLGLDICQEELHAFFNWYNNYCIGNSKKESSAVHLVEQLVKEEKFTWLDWMALNSSLIERKEKKLSFDPNLIRIKKSSIEVLVYYDEQLLFVIEERGLFRCEIKKEIPIQLVNLTSVIANKIRIAK